MKQPLQLRPISFLPRTQFGLRQDNFLRKDAGGDCAVKQRSFFQRRDDNKNKICTFEGVGRGVLEDNCPKTLLFLGNATTIKF